jgi:L-2-hydroxyglutarate oxidase LhgO
MLYEFCASHGVPHKKVGKLIVATDEKQTAKIEGIAKQGEINGVEGLDFLGGNSARAMEPALKCVAALLSNETGIIDSHGFMLALEGDLEDAGGIVVLKAPVAAGEVRNDGIRLSIGGPEPMQLQARTVINAAGLGAMDLSRALKGLPPQHAAPLWYAKGNYFRLTAKAPFSRLIYPIPVPGGLGTHMTLDLAGRARFGPDVEWVDSLTYAVDPRRGGSFYGDIRRYWPDLPDGALAPDYAGIRPKLGPAGSPILDFRIEGPAQHGVPGLVNLFGIESPGLTACLAIAEHVAGLIGESDRIQRRA